VGASLISFLKLPGVDPAPPRLFQELGDSGRLVAGTRIDEEKRARY
jgi:hypothetical protein